MVLMRKFITWISLILIFSVSMWGKINFFSKLFTEPIEILYIIMKDGTPFRYTSFDENRIWLNVEEMERGLRTPDRKYSISDIAIIIHNHLIEDKASDDDRRQLKDLKKHGFKGLFLIYCKRTNKTYLVQD